MFWHSKYLTILAPGGYDTGLLNPSIANNILSTIGKDTSPFDKSNAEAVLGQGVTGYDFTYGTSLSAAFIAAFIAILRNECKTLTPQQIETALCKSAIRGPREIGKDSGIG